MKDFTTSYGFQHVNSSPYFPQTNGQAEHTVKTVKTFLFNNKDHYMALLKYRETPFPLCGRNPAELLIRRQIRTTLRL